MLRGGIGWGGLGGRSERAISDVCRFLEGNVRLFGGDFEGIW